VTAPTTHRFKTIVVGFDGSDYSQRAVDVAAQLLDPDGTVHLVTAHDPVPIRQLGATFADVPTDLQRSVDFIATERAQINAASDALANASVDNTPHLLEGEPADTILRFAESVDADLVVVGSRGLGRASQVLRGSVSTKIAHKSPIDFLVIH